MADKDTPNVIVTDDDVLAQRQSEVNHQHLQTLLSRNTILSNTDASMANQPIKRKAKCIELMPGVRWYNLAAFLILYMVTYICSTLPDSFMTFILRDKNYYNVPEDVLAKDLGIITTYTMIVQIGVLLILGPIFDTLGRKGASLTGIFISGLAMAAVPQFNEIFPYFAIILCIMYAGWIVAAFAPFAPDYIQKGSLGLVNGMLEFMVCMAQLLARPLMLKLSDAIEDQAYIYYGISVFTILTTIFLAFAIKDVVTDKKAEREALVKKVHNEIEATKEEVPKDLSQKDGAVSDDEPQMKQSELSVHEEDITFFQKVSKIFKITFGELTGNAAFLVAFLGLGCDNITSTCLITYGTLILTDSYEAAGKTDKDAEAHLANLLLIATSIKAIIVISIGTLSDYVSPHWLMFTCNCVTIAAFTYLMTFIGDQTVQLGTDYDVAWICSYSLYATVHVLSLVILSKSVSDSTRGTMYTFNGICGNLINAVYQALAGWSYDKYSKKDPFYVAYCYIIFVNVMILIFGSLGKIKKVK